MEFLTEAAIARVERIMASTPSLNRVGNTLILGTRHSQQAAAEHEHYQAFLEALVGAQYVAIEGRSSEESSPMTYEWLAATHPNASYLEQNINHAMLANKYGLSAGTMPVYEALGCIATLREQGFPQEHHAGITKQFLTKKTYLSSFSLDTTMAILGELYEIDTGLEHICVAGNIYQQYLAEARDREYLSSGIATYAARGPTLAVIGGMHVANAVAVLEGTTLPPLMPWPSCIDKTDVAATMIIDVVETVAQSLLTKPCFGE